MESKITDHSTKAYLEELRDKIALMSPMDRACAELLVNFGGIIAELLNRRDWGTIEEMKAVIMEYFEQVEHAKSMPTVNIN